MEDDVFFDRAGPVKRVVLRDDPNVTARECGLAHHIDSRNADRARGGNRAGGGDGDCCGFARAVGAEQAEDDAFRHGEVDAVDGNHGQLGGVDFAETGDADDGFGHRWMILGEGLRHGIGLIKQEETMAAGAALSVPFTSVEEYLRTSFEHDADYVDGQIEERTVGEWDHGDIQGELIAVLRAHAREWNIRAATDVRVQVAATRFRVPDVCVRSASEPRQQIVRMPPLLCIEILSPEDRFNRVD